LLKPGEIIMKKHKFYSRIAAAGALLFAPASAGAWPSPTAAELAADKLISDFSAALNFSGLINPLPASEKKEKKKFFAARKSGAAYEPHFEYSGISAKASGMAAALESIHLGKTPYSPFLIEARDQLLAKLRILRNRGGGDFTALCSELYPRPSPDEVASALKELEKLGFSTPNRPTELGDHEMAGELEKALKEMKLDKWRVRISEKMSASASVSPGRRIINIKKGRRFARAEVARLVRHEIGVHAIRAENGHAMPLKIFQVGLEGYLETEEGMAAYREWSGGIDEGLRLFALRVLAVDWASRSPFSTVFKDLVQKGVPEEQAWALTQRVKRGLTDTGLPGCYTKDVAYFRGYLKVSRFMKNGGSWDSLMKYGKVSIDHLPALRAMEEVPTTRK